MRGDRLQEIVLLQWRHSLLLTCRLAQSEGDREEVGHQCEDGDPTTAGPGVLAEDLQHQHPGQQVAVDGSCSGEESGQRVEPGESFNEKHSMTE